MWLDDFILNAMLHHGIPVLQSIAQGQDVGSASFRTGTTSAGLVEKEPVIQPTTVSWVARGPYPQEGCLGPFPCLRHQIPDAMD